MALTAVSRRDLLRFSAAGVVLGAVPLWSCAALLPGSPPAAALLSSELPLPAPFIVPLPVPPVLEPTARRADADVYDLTAGPGIAPILPGRATPIFGYQGQFPGPTLVARRGRPVVLRLRNQLPVPTVLHLHGGRTPAQSDGFPTDLVLPAGWTAHDMADRAGRHDECAAGGPVSERSAGGHALVPRPPDGLHRTAGLAWPLRRIPRSRRRRGCARSAVRRARHPAADL